MTGRELTTEQIAAAIALADTVIERAVGLMTEAAVPANAICDRIITYTAAFSCLAYGKEHTAAQFRAAADNIERGMFDGVTGEGSRRN